MRNTGFNTPDDDLGVTKIVVNLMDLMYDNGAEMVVAPIEIDGVIHHLALITDDEYRKQFHSNIDN